METNAIISAHFGALLKILDARAVISVYKGESKDDLLKFRVRVYELLVDKEFMDKYEYYDITGLISTLDGANILIKPNRRG